MKIEPKLAILLVVLSGLLPSTVAAAPPLKESAALLYAVDQSANLRGAISVYDIAAEHRLIKTIHTVSNVADVRGVAASAITGKLYVAYIDVAGTGMVYCLNIYNDVIVWNKPISPGVDRLAINPDGRLLYVPTWEGGSADYINVVDANTGEVVREVHFSNRSHDTLYPLSGPIFQETKADDGSGKYLYLIDPKSYAVSRVGPYSGILGPYAVDSTSNYVVNNVMHLGECRSPISRPARSLPQASPITRPGIRGCCTGLAGPPIRKRCGRAAAGMTRMFMSGQWIIRWPRFSNKL
jgi:hypothetical protein